MTKAPSSTCLRAIDKASSYFFSLMSRKTYVNLPRYSVHLHWRNWFPEKLRATQSRQPQMRMLLHRHTRVYPCIKSWYLGNVLFRRTAASSDNIYQPFFDILLHFGSHIFGSLVILSQRIRQSGIRISTDIIRRTWSKLLQERFQLTGTKWAVQPDENKSACSTEAKRHPTSVLITYVRQCPTR